MFEHKVFKKCRSRRPCSAWLEAARDGSIGLAHRPERMLAYIPASGKTTLCIAIFDEAHRSSSRSVACLKDARRGTKQCALEARKTDLDFSKLSTPELAHLLPRRGIKIFQSGNLVKLRLFESLGIKP